MPYTATPPLIPFDYTGWQARFPELPIGCFLATEYYGDAGLYFQNDAGNPAACNIPNMTRLLWYLTAHLAYLFAPRDPAGRPAETGSPPPPIIGRISSASEGSVSVSSELKDSGSPSEAFFTQTAYGFAFWQATAQFRTARYIANPTIVPGGRLSPFTGYIGRGRIFPYYRI